MKQILNINSHSYSINSEDSNAILNFYQCFDLCLSNILPENTENVILLCIGSDRSTGDCLGPLIGHRLYKFKYNNIHIVGTLENPTHAKNLEKNINTIKDQFPNPFVIAVDACLGMFDTIGYIKIGPGPLKPGAGVNKYLPWVGNMYIKGIVNTGGFMEHIILQNTRLHVVMKMVDIISSGLNKHFLLMSNTYNFNSASVMSQPDKC